MKILFCPKCGSKQEGNAFCSECGNNLSFKKEGKGKDNSENPSQTDSEGNSQFDNIDDWKTREGERFNKGKGISFLATLYLFWHYFIKFIKITFQNKSTIKDKYENKDSKSSKNTEPNSIDSDDTSSDKELNFIDKLKMDFKKIKKSINEGDYKSIVKYEYDIKRNLRIPNNVWISIGFFSAFFAPLIGVAFGANYYGISNYKKLSSYDKKTKKLGKIMLIISIVIFLFNSLFKDEFNSEFSGNIWTPKIKNTFMISCIENATDGKAIWGENITKLGFKASLQQARCYCIGALEKTMELYPNPKNVDNNLNNRNSKIIVDAGREALNNTKDIGTCL